LLVWIIQKILAFVEQFEDMDVTTQYMEGTMNANATTATSTKAEQVDELIEQVANASNLGRIRGGV
jgi:hypothetical protein